MTDDPPEIPASQEATSAALAREMLADGASYDEIARQLGMPKAAKREVEKVLKRMEQSDQ